MTENPRLHAFILCWPGKEEGAHHIAQAVEGSVDRLTVLYKNDTGRTEAGAGEWVRIPSDWYYGRQFRHTLDRLDGDVMLQIQADAIHGDWPGLVDRCRAAFRAHPAIGVWSPDVYHSWYTPALTRIEELGDGLATVSVTDGVVWALAAPVTRRMAALDYERNNFGWGLTEAGAAMAASHDMLVTMDLSCFVEHPKGSGYDRDTALAQSRQFSAQLSPAERNYVNLALIAAKLRDRPSRARFLRPSYWREKLGRCPPAAAAWRAAWTSSWPPPSSSIPATSIP